MGLYDGIMIKDNHKRLCGGIGEAVTRAQANRGRGTLIYAEAETVAEAEEAAAAGADVVMLDNFDPDSASEACHAIKGRAAVEISGGVKLSNVATYARTGASRISVGALTHSAPAIDFSLEVEV
jgi:nicotinate-nucleotide pyrophosphorylase (carboxylating)